MALWGWSGGEKWSFVIDTDEYAGNFERELCAYVIGKVDWSYVSNPYDTAGGDYLKMFDKDCGIELEDLSDTRISDPGDDGITRAPCDLAPTPGWSNDGHGNEYKVRPNSKKYSFKHPAYRSVAIFLRRKPSDEELAELVKRALEFPTLPKINEWDSRPAILGCRLVKETVLVEATPAWSPEQ